MFKTIQEGLESYKRELKSYLEWLKARGCKIEDSLLKLKEVDYPIGVSRCSSLSGMEKVLGLEKEEIKEIRDEVMPIDDLDDVVIQEKSEWQEDNCLFCPGEATKEATYRNSFIRCCEKEKCQNKAKKMAFVQGNLFNSPGN